MKIAAIFLSAPMLLGIAGCATTAMQAATPAASAQLLAGDGATRGSATVTQAADGLHILVKATGLAPGIHAVHVHMTGLCTGPDFTSAGGHWNPTGRKHGKDNPAGMHMGDMPNMLVRPDGTGDLDYVIPDGQLTAGAVPLLDADGAAIVVHAKADDNITDPAGNAGGRIACGVLTAQ